MAMVGDFLSGGSWERLQMGQGVHHTSFSVIRRPEDSGRRDMRLAVGLRPIMPVIFKPWV